MVWKFNWDAEEADQWTYLWGKRTFSGGEKKDIYKRDKGICRYCGLKLLRKNAHFDHVFPWSKGGTTTVENGAVSCRPCNIRKKDKTDLPPDVVGLFFQRLHRESNLRIGWKREFDYYTKTRWINRLFRPSIKR